MKESEKLHQENDQLQKKIEQQLANINKDINEMIKKMRG